MSPFPFNQDIFDEILEIISSSSKSMASILGENDHFPKVTTFYKWLKEEEAAKDYARAKQDQAVFMAEEIIEIADDSSKDTIRTEKGDIPDNEWINRSRLRVDSRKWLASKLYPKLFGDKVDMTTGGDKMPAPIIQIIRPE